jgi:hypothetical protein
MLIRFYSGCGCYYETNTVDGYTSCEVVCVFHRVQRHFEEKNKKKQVING